MAKALTRLRLLVSCSSELQAERGLLEKVVDDVNRTVEDAYGVTLRTIDWKRDIIPGAGVDPQQVINSQSTDYEIYFGMLGTRFGTPTPRSGSGTEDEFNAAYKRFRKDPQSVRLLVYFRTGFAGGLMDVDPDQLRRVQEFRARLGQEAGLLFCDFAAGEEFMQLCRHHLIQLIATQWAGEHWNAVPGLAPTDDAIDHLISGEPASADDEEPGLLDLRVRQDEAFESAMSVVRQIADLMSTWADADR